MGANCAKESKEEGKRKEEDHSKRTTSSEEKPVERKNSSPKSAKREMKVYTMEDVAKSTNLMVVDGYVVDCECFDKDHPGGAYAIVQYVKKNATDMFVSSHGKKGVSKMKALTVGTIE